MLKAIREFQFEIPHNYDYLPIVVLSYFCFLTLYRVVSPKLSAKFSKTYPRLAYNNKVEWNLRLTSTIFSVVVSSICSYVLLVDHAIASSPLLYDSKLVKTNIAIVMGHMLCDMTIILANYRIIGDAFTLVHHCATLFGYSHALTYSVMPYFANFRLIVELSTPLVNMRWFFYAVGYKKDSLHFFINGIVMTALFFTVRVVSIPLYWYKVYTVLDSPLWTKMRHFRFIMIVTCVLLDIINVYWFRKMFRGAQIVWSTNWQYYAEHHRSQHAQLLSSYPKALKSKLLNSLLLQSTVQGWNKINLGKYLDALIDRKIYMPKMISEFLNRNSEEADHTLDFEHTNLSKL